MADYKGYFIFGKALKVYTDSLYWCSQGDVYTNEPAGSVLVARLEGVIFESEQAAKAHGLELCRQWIDKKPIVESV
jgi:hypothetical protein